MVANAKRKHGNSPERERGDKTLSCSPECYAILRRIADQKRWTMKTTLDESAKALSREQAQPTQAHPGTLTTPPH